MFNLARARNGTCAGIIDDIAAERALAASSLRDLDGTLQEILNEQRVSRQTFDDAACSFIRHEKRQIEIEEQQLFPAASPILTAADWADIHAKLRDEIVSLRTRRLKDRLRTQRHWIVREALADQAERSGRPEVRE